MSNRAALDVLLARVDSLEDRTRLLEKELGPSIAPERPPLRAQPVGTAGRWKATTSEQGRRPSRLSRARFLRKAGALVAGAAGAAVLAGRGTRDVFAATDTNFTASGGSGAAFSVATSGYSFGANLTGSSYGISASSSGTGVYGTSIGSGSIAGVYGNSSTVGGLFSGGQAQISLVPAFTAGPPTSGVHAPGDVWVDSNRAMWICTVGGTPGTFVPLVEGNVTNPTTAQTTLLATAGYAAPAVLVADINQAANPFSFVDGVRGIAVNGSGVSGSSSGGYGAVGSSGSSLGVYGSSNTSLGGLFSGGRAPINLVPASGVVGPPTSGFHSTGDVWMDFNGAVWVCTVAGTPGTFVPLQQGGQGNALFTAVSTQQYTLANSDGSTWVDMDATTLKLTLTPGFKGLAILTGNSDLWTANAGYNQDLGITITGGAYPTTLGQPEAWKESGGFAGTFSPNAAFVQTVVPLAAGTTYTVKLQWKANKPASGATIYAGAGPIAGKFSPTRLTALLIPT